MTRLANACSTDNLESVINLINIILGQTAQSAALASTLEKLKEICLLSGNVQMMDAFKMIETCLCIIHNLDINSTSNN